MPDSAGRAGPPRAAPASSWKGPCVLDRHRVKVNILTLVSSALLLVCSATIQFALRAIRRGDQRRLTQWLYATGFVSLLFLGCQTVGWLQLRNMEKGLRLGGMLATLGGLSAGLLATEPDLPWAQIAGMWDRLTHRYNPDLGPGLVLQVPSASEADFDRHRALPGRTGGRTAAQDVIATLPVNRVGTPQPEQPVAPVVPDQHVVRVRPGLVVELAFDGVQESPRYPGGVALRFARVRGHRVGFHGVVIGGLVELYRFRLVAANQRERTVGKPWRVDSQTRAPSAVGLRGRDLRRLAQAAMPN